MAWEVGGDHDKHFFVDFFNEFCSQVYSRFSGGLFRGSVKVLLSFLGI